MLEKKKFSENRPVAWLAFALVVVLCIAFSGGGGLKRQRAAAMNAFYYGVNNDGLSIYNDLAARMDCAYNLISIAKRYDTIDQSKVEELETAAQALESTAKTDVQALFTNNTRLTRAVEDVYTEIENASLSEADQKFALSQYKECGSRALTIGRDGYNSLAEEFNALRGGFPAGIAAALSGTGELPLFR